MKLNNPFPDKVRLLWLNWWRCMLCNGNGMNSGGLELHHITGRDSNCAFNAAPVCGKCHSHLGHSQEEERNLTAKLLPALRAKGYKPTEEDLEHLAKHPYLLINNKKLEDWLAQ